MQPVNMQARLQDVIPEGYQVQKVKCKGTRPHGEVPADLSVDLVVQALADLPSGRSYPLTRVKAVREGSLVELGKTVHHTEGLIIARTLKGETPPSPAEVEALRTAWKVEPENVFDLSRVKDKKEKSDVKDVKRPFQAKQSGDLNKVVYNPDSPQSKKAKITFSDKYLLTVLDGMQKKEAPFHQVESWKFCLDFTGVKKEVFDRLLDCVKSGLKVQTKKSAFTEAQSTALEAAKAEAKKAKK